MLYVNPNVITRSTLERLKTVVTALNPAEGVAGTSRMQRDGLHPTADGNRLVAATVMRYLRPLLGGK